MRLKVWCDRCGELINENDENNCVIYKPIRDDVLVFCDNECCDEFIKEFITSATINYKGVITED